ncbi:MULTISPECIES: 2Fe-2S iron-sulfur cluster-binding protein [unclassified Halorhabdus]|uniref:2Fe-2S iron-sulfur cluster-binding protein n=1 Tax=unclassified Halorhabdus TaxID=2621901 RepID=UPI0023DC4A79|nr:MULTISPECIES: 2Fe-2S iron-sulfur cluster-binding protein [unclassified Halorhabdus]WEL18836.1 Formate dehydrogenase major subunit [Halorhabdus sp. SVX81]WEL22489.1 Formate dehydrogenase major subunit [Halorhabdus sp. BNX81]
MSKATQSEAETGVTLEIDGREVQARDGQTILEAAREAGIDIPTLCEHANLSNVGACRMCLVEVDGERNETACTTAVQDGMDISVDTDELWNHRRTMLEMMFADQNHYCMYCEMEGDCELEDMFNRAGLDSSRVPLEYPDIEPDTSNEYVTMDLDRCIGCGRCIRTCDEIVGNGTLNFGNRGRETTIVADDDVPLGESSCISCGSCVQACPTGALYSPLSAYKGRERDCEVETTTCSECSVGCELEVFTNSGRIVKIEGNEDGPAGGQLCEMGRFELLADGRERITEPRVDGETVDLADAIDRARTALTEANGVNAFASDRLPRETLEALSETLSEYDASVEIPGAERAALESDVLAALEAELDVETADLLVDSLHDIEDSDTLVVYDTGIVETHPVVASYVRRAANGETTLVTIDDGTDRLERFADHSIELDAPTATVTEQVTDVFEAGTEALADAAIEDVVDVSLELSGDATFVLGPDVDDAETMVDVFGLAATSDNDVLSLGPGRNRAVADVPTDDLEADAEVAYLLAADDRGEDLDRQIELARGAETVIVQATRESALTEIADIVLPALDWFEREGTTVDADDDQRAVERVLDPRGEIDSDREIIAELQEVAA